jgi:hypothetical protein
MTMRPNAESRLRNLVGPSMRFVLVNERSPRADAHCAVCCTRIDRGYVRAAQTRLLYCDAQCFAEHEWMSRPARTRDARRVS